MIKLIGVSNLCVFVDIYFLGGGKSVADLYIPDFSAAKRKMAETICGGAAISFLPLF